MQSQVFDLRKQFVGLGREAVTRLQIGDDFWRELEAGRLGAIAHLVSCWSVDEDWNHWEYCEQGGDLVCLMSGVIDLQLEQGDVTNKVRLTSQADTLLIPPDTWYRATVVTPGLLLFVTPGGGNRTRPA
ncbi:MAG: hypothetical protein QNJ73_05500 [Gammaproteobacteria bacterium]|nr:hypothetical protein [Gammaproteobacteria bacterium]